MNGAETAAREDAELELLMVGVPLYSDTHGGVGWSTVGLLRLGPRVVLLDAGGPGSRLVLLERLADRGVRPRDVTDVLLTHLHWDHVYNVTLFPEATVHVGARELAWAAAAGPGPSHVAELHAAFVAALGPRLRTLEAGDEALPGVRALDLSGHTPGHLGFLLELGPTRSVFVGDAVKNRVEYLSGSFRDSADHEASRAALGRLVNLSRTGPLRLLFGHDDPILIQAGRVVADPFPLTSPPVPTVSVLDPVDRRWHSIVLQAAPTAASTERSLP